MQRSARLQVVLQLADAAVQKAAEQLEKTRALLEQAQQKHNELGQYYQDYQDTFNNSPAQPVATLARLRSFLHKLRDAQQQQQSLITHIQHSLKQQQKIWHQAYLKQRAISQLIERLKKDEQLLLSRKEEKRLDEWTQQAAQRHKRARE